MTAATMDKTRLLKTLKAKRARLESLLGGLDESQMTQPGVDEGWSIKDLLAHFAAWDRRGTLWIKAAAEGKVPAIPEPGAPYKAKEWARLNEKTFVENRDRALDEVVAEFHNSYSELLKQVAALSEEDLARRFEIGDQKEQVTVQELVCWRYNHWQAHGKHIRAWLNDES